MVYDFFSPQNRVGAFIRIHPHSNPKQPGAILFIADLHPYMSDMFPVGQRPLK